ncbi:tRNA preQ1(34) S-adenosylmethionine ribosyltransferase-isomerase QueA [Betaproteobacteria bacterium GR16-43]|nr:tRNA preQ1(34) S-adenosylmethionine ribosyltransferase-isomerase QueA [Betaproteobacteria bacterium GR16-43]
MRISDFDYELPPELIAQHPAPERAASRLLHLDGRTGALEDLAFRDLASLVDSNDVLVFNDTKVIKARLRGRKDTGGDVEVLVERVLDEHRALAHVRASKSPKAGRKLILADAIEAEVLGRVDDLYELRFEGGATVLDQLAKHGEVPLPPYITHKPDAADESRYQTVYAREPGAVAAPTAGLHFDERTLQALSEKGTKLAHVTLHVGAGTFQPVRGEVSDHVMHSEWYSIPEATVEAIEQARARRGRVIAVGTTTLRALEASAASGALRAGSADTRIFITPGFEFRVVDRLITNFHLPKSTLLMLVSAFAGLDNVRRAYAHAVAERYRFFSYGDAMLVERAA